MSRSVGSFEARQTNLWSADVRFQVIVFPEVLVAVRTGGQFAGTGGYVLRRFGLIGAGLAAIFGGGDAAEGAERAKDLEGRPPDELLRRHERNFRVPVARIGQARLGAKSFSMHGDAVASLAIDVTGGDTVELLIQSRDALVSCRDVLAAVLGPRLRVDEHVAAAKAGPRPAAAGTKGGAVAPPGWRCPACGKSAIPSANQASYVCENMHVTLAR